MTNGIIDLRSDTVTLPTREMMDAIFYAQLGDDVKGEDRSTNALEEYAADLLGKEAAMLVTSGTMGNLAAILTHTQQGRAEMIAQAKAHIVMSEAGNYAYLGSVAVRTVEGRHGGMDPREVESLIRNPANVHHPRTALICMENSHNYAGGTVVSLEDIGAVRKVADAYGIPMHLDGARIFNAATALNVPASSIAAGFDSVQICLSKGLSAPVGSLVVGTKDFIKEARYFRKMLGGGMRQCGIIAAAGLVALKTMPGRLAEDHETAALLAKGIEDIPGIAVDMETVQTNMVRIDVSGLGVTAVAFVDQLARHGVLCGDQAKYAVRFVTHRHITKEDVVKTIDVTAAAAAELRKAM